MSNWILNGQIFEKIATAVWAMPKIWGKYFPLIVENRIVKHNWLVIRDIFGYTDLDQCLPMIINDDRMNKANAMALGYMEAAAGGKKE